MKKKLIYLFMFVMVLSLTGCGTKQKLEEKVAEKVIEDASGGKVDIDGDTIKMQGKDGEDITIGGTKWPNSDLVKNIPKFEDGTIISVMETKDTSIINLDQVKKEDFVKYLEEIKKDYTEEAYEVTSEGNVTYGANNVDGINVQIFYMDKTVNITVTQAQE